MLLIRLIRSLFAFGIIFTSYLVQLGLARIFGQWTDDDGRPTGDRVLPRWLVERRRRVDQKNARRLLRGMLRLRGVFIKLGQVLSIMGGFLPRVYAKELEQLQDQVPPHPFSDLEAAFAESFGKAPDALFASIEREPIAAASLGQVHVAHLHDGRKVAVKFLYPNIRGIIAVDMRVLRLAIRAYRWFVPVAKIERVHEQLVDMLQRETDYLHEAECMRRMARNFAGEKGILFPEPIAELTTRDVLTMSFMPGFKITKKAVLTAAGVPAGEVATRLVQAFYKMLFVDRFFHADPHPGNFLVTEDGRLALLDFGCMLTLSKEDRAAYARLVVAIAGNNSKAAAAELAGLGFIADDPDQLVDLTAALIGTLRPGANTADIDWQAAMSAQLAQARQLGGLVIPRSFVLLGRVLASVAGLLATYKPRLELHPLIARHLAAALA